MCAHKCVHVCICIHVNVCVDLWVCACMSVVCVCVCVYHVLPGSGRSTCRMWRPLSAFSSLTCPTSWGLSRDKARLTLFVSGKQSDSPPLSLALLSLPTPCKLAPESCSSLNSPFEIKLAKLMCCRFSRWLLSWDTPGRRAFLEIPSSSPVS